MADAAVVWAVSTNEGIFVTFASTAFLPPPLSRQRGYGAPPLPARILPARLPAAAGSCGPLVALHGISRGSRAVWSAFAPLAGERSLIVPHFSRRYWPRFQQIGRQRPDLALLALLDRAEAEHGIQTDRITLFGYSGGAQLAHRFAMLYPHRIAELHLAAPGWYCLPDVSTPWPEGLGPRASGVPSRVALLKQRQLAAFLALPLRLYVGGEDTTRDPALRQSATLDARQGQTRLERAHRYRDAFHAAATRHGITPDVTLTVLPGCRHDFTECALTGGLAARVLSARPHPHD